MASEYSDEGNARHGELLAELRAMETANQARHSELKASHAETANKVVTLEAQVARMEERIQSLEVQAMAAPVQLEESETIIELRTKLRHLQDHQVHAEKDHR